MMILGLAKDTGRADGTDGDLNSISCFLIQFHAFFMLRKTIQKMSTSATELKPVKFTLKTPKGTRDFTPPEMALRNKIFKTITNVFETHGAVTVIMYNLD